MEMKLKEVIIKFCFIKEAILANMRNINLFVIVISFSQTRSCYKSRDNNEGILKKCTPYTTLNKVAVRI